MISKKEATERKRTLKGLTLKELRDYFISIGEPGFRAEQVFKWVYGDMVDGFDELNNLPKSLRQKLSEEFNINTLRYFKSETSFGSTKTPVSSSLFTKLTPVGSLVEITAFS